MSMYKKIRPYILWGGLVIIVAGLVFLSIKELTTPLKGPSIPSDLVSTVPPKTEPPTAEAKAEHRVPPTYPKHLVIPKLNINTNIYAVAKTESGAIDAPQTAWGVGWYQDGTLPGAGSGAALIDGHVNDAFNTPGVFYELSNLKAGDEITIIRGDDSKLHYKVVKVSEELLSNIDMNKVLSSVETGKEGLNLVTCGGKYDSVARTYTNRVIVYTVRIS